MIGFSLCLVAIKPDVANVLRDIFFLKKIQYSRIIAILVFSNFLTWIFLIYLKEGLDKKDKELDTLTLKLGMEKFREQYGNVKFEKIVVIIPTYNELENLKVLLEAIHEAVSALGVSMLIIDDASTDDTCEHIFQQGCYVVSNKINRGGGASLILGYSIAREAAASVIVTMDADNQHNPRYITDLVEPIINGDADVVIGSRIMGKNEDINLVRSTGLYLYNRLIRILTGIKITDCSSGFRAFRAQGLTKLNLEESRYHTSELIIKGAKRGLSIIEVPIIMKPRLFGKTKKGGSLKYGLNFLRVIIKTWWRGGS